MKSIWSGIKLRSAAPVACAFFLTLPLTFAQQPDDPNVAPPDTQQSAPLLSPDQLSNLVAPIALYPDPLLSQVLSASTYPLEIVEAQQWLARNKNLQGTQLVEAAREQNWDPSVQALVVFPDTLEFLAKDIRWTTDLGNAFLAQQSDVMGAVQTLRARAKANGRLTTTPQQVVTMESQDGRDAIEIQPADPQVIYVPVYNPVYVWGPPVYGAYPSLWYPSGFGMTFGFGPAYYMGAYFPSWGGWGGWGWNCGWFGRGLYVNVGFFSRYGYRGGHYYAGYPAGRGYNGRPVWSHDPGHRGGIPYPNRVVANRFAGDGPNGRPSGSWRSFGDPNRSNMPARSGGNGFTPSARNGSGPDRPPSQGWSTNGGTRDSRRLTPENRGSRSMDSANSAVRSAPRDTSRWSTGSGAGSAPGRMSSAPRSAGSSPGFSGGRSAGPSGSSAGRMGGGGGGGHRR
jgi:hypothetical protein